MGLEATRDLKTCTRYIDVFGRGISRVSRLGFGTLCADSISPLGYIAQSWRFSGTHVQAARFVVLRIEVVDACFRCESRVRWACSLTRQGHPLAFPDTDCCESVPDPPHGGVRSYRQTVTAIRMNRHVKHAGCQALETPPVHTVGYNYVKISGTPGCRQCSRL